MRIFYLRLSNAAIHIVVAKLT